MEPKTGKPKIFLNYIFPVLTTILGCGIGYLVAPGDKSDTIIELQHRQIDTLSNGFNKLVKAVENSNSPDAQVVNNIISVNSQLNSLIRSTNENYQKYVGNNTRIDTLVPVKMVSPQESQNAVEDRSLPPVRIETKISVTEAIDNNNYFAVTHEYETGTIAISINGNSTSMKPGAKRSLDGTDGKKFDFVYDRKVTDNYVFLIFKK